MTSRSRRIPADEYTEWAGDDEVLCPYCEGGIGSDLWELDMDDGDNVMIHCASCDKPIVLRCCVTTEYCAGKPKEESGG